MVTSNLPNAMTEWLDPALLPFYGMAGAALYYIVRYIDNAYIRPPSKTGFGKGAPGFMTNTRQLRVTPEIAARLRRGEQVSPEEIDAAVRAAEVTRMASPETFGTPESATSVKRTTRSASKKSKAAAPKASTPLKEEPAVEANEWIPDTHIKKGSQRKKQK